MAVAQLRVNPTPAPQSDSKTYSAQDILSLQQQSDRLAHLLEVMPAGVVVIDGQGNVRQANQVAIDLLGEPLEGQSWRMIIQRSFRPQADDGHEVSLYDGRKVKLSICPLEKEPGQLIVLTDLTETRQLQQRVSHMQRLSSLGNMVASLAHQIRTPLSAAMLYAANIANSRLDQTSRQKFSDKLLSRLHDLEHQVNDMLLFAKSGSEQVVTELSMQSLLAEVEAGGEAMLSQHQASMDVQLPDPDIIILGNRTALAGALQNLIHNSLQIKPQGAHIILSAKRDSQDPGHVLLSVKDNGPGIEPQYIEQLFEPFYTTRSQGTGLGLAVVKAVAQSHKGTVSAVSPETGGACFTLKLPIFIPTQPIKNPFKQELTA
ncbi:sensor histidine kinase [Neptunicella sp.]|uniref:sensor histidine kinase n=1 Tax=Neptunicella sp. TaxID=2125986 RepID=UPI003F691F01